MTLSVATGKRNAQLRLAHSMTGWLGLAASPTFALMAWFAESDASGIPICSSAAGPLPIGDMAWMYLLMCLFHISPWLKFIPGHARPFDQPTSSVQGE